MRKIIENSSTSTVNVDKAPSIPVNLYYRNQMTSQYIQDEENLQNLVKCNVQPAEGKEIILYIYYKNKKLQQLLIKNNPYRITEENRVVYKYICPREECQLSQTYIGYTTNPLKKRFTMHAQNGSIIDHHTQTHGQREPTKSLLDATTVLYRSSDVHELKIAEALYIQQESPPINSQREGETRILNIF